MLCRRILHNHSIIPISFLLPRVPLVPPFSSTLSLFPLPELNLSSRPFYFCVSFVESSSFTYYFVVQYSFVQIIYSLSNCLSSDLLLLFILAALSCTLVSRLLYSVFFNSLALYFCYLTCPIFIGRSFTL